MHQLKPYPKYKPTNIQWLGDVPEHWEVRRTKTLLRQRVEKGFPDEPLLAATQNKGVVRKEEYENRTALAQKDLHLLKLARIGDFVISLRSFQGGIEQVHQQGIISPAYTILETEDSETRGFLAILFKSQPYIENLKLHVTGIRQGQNIDYEKLSRSYIPLPPLDEQRAIARYLDYKTSLIDTYTSNKRKLVDLLQEYRQALIHETVTRGLDPDVKLKPSGIQWLGDIPEHWHVGPVKRHYSIRLGKMLQNYPRSNSDTEAPYLKVVNVQWFHVDTSDPPKMWASPHEIDQYGIKEGDLLVCEGGEGGRCGMVGKIERGYIIQNALHRVRPLRNNLNRYLQYVMSQISASGWFEAINNKATIAHFTAEKFESLRIPLPPLAEQRAVADYLDRKTAKIDLAIDLTRQEIELLQEYRTRLIADVVTGQLDVRDYDVPATPV